MTHQEDYINELEGEIGRLKNVQPNTGFRCQLRGHYDLTDQRFHCTSSELVLVEGLHFDVVLRVYPWFKDKEDGRICLRRKNTLIYEDLQATRSEWRHWSTALAGIDNLKASLKERVARLFSSVDPGDICICVRLRDIQLLRDADIITLKDDMSIIELGFRSPTLMEYFRQKGNKFIGYDIVKFNILRAKALGYDARYYDFDDCEPDLDLSEGDLIMCYQLLEHISDPYTALLKIYDSMKPGAYLHAEVPVETGFPRVKFGHMFSFGPKDLHNMAQSAGFSVIGCTDLSWPGASAIMRIFCKKPDDLDDCIGEYRPPSSPEWVLANGLQVFTAWPAGERLVIDSPEKEWNR